MVNSKNVFEFKAKLLVLDPAVYILFTYFVFFLSNLFLLTPCFFAHQTCLH